MKRLLLLTFILLSGIANAQVFWPTEELEVIDDFAPYILSSLASADLNNDGTDEIIYYSYYSTTKIITIYNPVDGTSLELGNSYSAGTFKFGDFDEDGFLDILHLASSATVYLSDDSKSFLESGFYSGTLVTGTAIDAAIGDYDEDNNLDIIVGTSSPNKWIKFKGDGLGGFTETNLGLPTSWNAVNTYTVSIELVDFNGDDNLDIVASGKSQPTPLNEYGITISLGDGAGNFTLASDYFTTQDASANKPYYYGDGQDKPLLTDIDSDGEIDIIFNGQFGTGGSAILNNGTSAPTISSLGFSLGSRYDLVDFDGDLKDDIILYSSGGHYDVMLADGAGAFNYDRSFATSSNQGSVFTMADANGDGDKDIVFSDAIDKKIYFASFDDGYKNFNGLVGEYELRDETYYDADLADLDGDGYDEMLTLHNDSLVVMINNDIQWSFAEASYYITPENPKALEVVDLSGDDFPEVIIGSADVSNNNITIFTNDNSGNLSSSTQFTTDGILDIASGDLNGNGVSDVVAITNTDILVMLNNGSGTLAAPVNISFSNGRYISTGDINGDGFLDVIAKNSSGRIYLWTGDGSGGLTSTGLNDFVDIGSGNETHEVADFNNDGLDDIVSINYAGSYQVMVALGEAGKLMSELTLVSTGSFYDPVDFNIGDFNGDGNMDIILDQDHSQEIKTFLGDGTGNFADPIPQIAISSESSSTNVHIAVGDVNFDDKTDVAIVKLSRAYMLLNVFTEASEPSIAASNLVVGTPEFTGTDISWDRGNGDAVMVLIAEGALDMAKLPVDFSLANDLGINSIVYDGSGTSTTTGILKKNTLYEVGVIEYSGSTISANYFTSGFPTASFTTPKSAQTITFDYSADVAYTQNPYAGTATASSGLEITYEVVSGPAEITTEGLIQLTGVGSVTLRAKQAGDDEYDAAPNVEQTFDVIQGTQTIPFTLAATTFIDYDNYELPIYSSGGLAISYNLDSGPGSLITDGDTTWYAWDGEGSITITATQAGSTEFSAAVPVVRASIVSKKDQTITWNNSQYELPNGSYTYAALGQFDAKMRTDTLVLNATSTSGLPVDYIILSGPGFLKGIGAESNKYIYSGVGDVTISAGASGDEVYNTAFPVGVDFTIIKGDQTISYNAEINGAGLSNYAYDPDVWVKLNGASTSGLDVSYEVTGNGVAVLVDDSVNVTTAGSILVSITQLGDDNWNAAIQSGVSWSVSKATQTIVFEDIYENMIVKDSVIALGGTNESGIEISYNIVRNPSSSDVSISGNEFTVVSTSRSGAITIGAHSVGNDNYSQSDQVLVDFCLLAGTPTLTVDGLGTAFVTLTSSNSVDRAEWEKDGGAPFEGSFQTIVSSQSEVGVYKVRASSHDLECPVSDWSNEISLLITGLGELANQLSIYPNPAETNVSVKLPSEMAGNIEVFATDMNGRTKTLNHTTQSATQLSLDVSQLPKGNYILHLRAGEQVFYHKLNKK